MATNTIVTMTVNTQDITPTTINENVIFSDNQGNRQRTNDPENFIADVYQGSDILWQGVAEDGTTEITIQDIVKESGPDIMEPGTMTHPGRDIKCDIVNHIVSPTNLEKYSLKFRIHGCSDDFPPIDPKIRMKVRHLSLFVIKARQFVELFKIIGKILFKWTN